MNIKNGGPAFPVNDPRWLQPETVDEGKRIASGMTMRDYFAAKALKIKAWSVRPYDTRSEIAKDCYAMADAMLAEREKTNG